MSIKKITDALIESCVSMNKNKILSPEALTKCNSLNELNVLKGFDMIKFKPKNH